MHVQPEKPEGIHDLAEKALNLLTSVSETDVQIPPSGIDEIRTTLETMPKEELRWALMSLMKLSMVLSQGGSEAASDQLVEVALVGTERLEAYNSELEAQKKQRARNAQRLTGRRFHRSAPQVGASTPLNAVRVSSLHIPQKIG